MQEVDYLLIKHSNVELLQRCAGFKLTLLFRYCYDFGDSKLVEVTAELRRMMSCCVAGRAYVENAMLLSAVRSVLSDPSLLCCG